MTDKEKYSALMQRYWEAETTPEEERELAWYAVRVNDPDFEKIRGVLGYLSIGRKKKDTRARSVRMYSFAAVAAIIVAVVAIGLNLETAKSRNQDELCVRNSYGEISKNNAQIMSSVETSLSDFFAGNSLVENNLREMLQR